MSFTLSSTAFAQDGKSKTDTPDMRAKVIKDSESGSAVTRPDGWVQGKSGKGVLATFHAAGDKKAQIEVRLSPHVKEDQGEIFFASFHSSLQKAGFTRDEVREKQTYEGKTGVETEYKTTSGKKEFKMIIWQFQQDDAAYLVVGFFPAKGRDKYYGDFKKVIESLKVD
ncbi:hypothetical protein DN745_10250 [Bradymonas sediminis]|uniref:PsbP C-terminal domain-containing protein n=2 Tax=Bradymonas sediminis TaxID=1548548 RepID=A0A2Z4FLJ9_9DELT|nr:hypothetical protein DN745_10250 [Bradymonas sediminis]